MFKFNLDQVACNYFKFKGAFTKYNFTTHLFTYPFITQTFFAGDQPFECS